MKPKTPVSPGVGAPTRRCKVCLKVRPDIEFKRDPRGPLGHVLVCTPCAKKSGS